MLFEVDSTEPLLGGREDAPNINVHRKKRRAGSSNYTPVATVDHDDFLPTTEKEAHSTSGCIPCTNSCVVVPQDEWYTVEKFGKFESILGPGLTFTGFDICGCCIGFRSMTKRIRQSICEVHTKTKDHVFVTLTIAVQHSVSPENVWQAMYVLADEERQIESHVSDVVRSKVPQMLLDDSFANCREISNAIQIHLSREMEAYGFQIHNALVTDLVPERTVKNAMNEIMTQKMRKEAVTAAAEANRIKVVKEAEGNARAMELQGEGSARQVKEIVKGLSESLSNNGETPLSTEKVSEIFLITQYFETMRLLAASDKAEVIFTPLLNDAIADAGNESVHPPQQNTMGQEDALRGGRWGFSGFGTSSNRAASAPPHSGQQEVAVGRQDPLSRRAT